MRRFAVVVGAVFMAVAVSSPAYAYAHDRVANPWLHSALDVLTLVVVTSPLWTARLWGTDHRRGLLLLVGVVQIPAAVFAFIPIADPLLHATGLLIGLTVTGTSLWYVRKANRLTESSVADRPAIVS